MSDHDSRCPELEFGENADRDCPSECQCDLIARVRADEQEKAKVALRQEWRVLGDMRDERDAAKARTVEWMDRYNAQVDAERQSMGDLRAKVEKEAARDLGPAATPTQVGFDEGRADAFAVVLALLEVKP